MATVTLHRCWLDVPKTDRHPCRKVEHALEDQGIAYEVAKHSVLRGRRAALEARTGQRHLPAIEFEDGRVYRAESSEMAARILAGELFSAP